MSVLKMGSKGEEVRNLQAGLAKLGFKLAVDGDFGQNTHNAVITMQTIFGYDVDGLAGPATRQLIDKQAEYGWNLEAARKAFAKSVG